MRSKSFLFLFLSAVIFGLSACSGALSSSGGSSVSGQLPTTVAPVQTSALAHIAISSNHPLMPAPINVVVNRDTDKMHAFTTTGDPVTIVHVTPPIPASALTNIPKPDVPGTILPTPYPYPTPSTRPPCYITKTCFHTPPPCYRCWIHTLSVNPESVVTSDDSGGQGGYTIAGGSQQQSGVGDIYVAQEALTNVSLSPVPPNSKFPGNSLYAPTTHGPNGNCLEVPTDYYDGWGLPTGVTSGQVLFFNFCDGGGKYEGAVPMDQSFFNTYVRVFSNGNGTPEYIIELERGSDNEWHTLLYNVTDNRWDDYVDSAANATSNFNGGQGWSMIETHFDAGNCPDIPSTGISGLRLHYSNIPHQNWQYANGSKQFTY